MLWFGSFAGACMAATGHACGAPGSDCIEGMVSMVATPCEQAVAPCELPQLSAPASVKFELPPLPLAAATALFHSVLPQAAPLPRPEWEATRPPHTPLYLRYLALLH